jgi:uncharacterized protein YqfB (UPF0267 family)
MPAWSDDCCQLFVTAERFAGPYSLLRRLPGFSRPAEIGILAGVRFSLLPSNTTLGSVMLLFKKKFLDAIRAGQKTQTIRLWKFARMRAGQRSYIPGVGYIRIETVDPVELDSLTEEDAQRDGFPSADELRAEIGRLYPDGSSNGHRPFRIRFAVLPPEEQKKA